MPIINTVNILGGGIQGVSGNQGSQGAIGSQGIQNFEGIHNVWRTSTANTVWLTYNMNGGTTTTAGLQGNRMYFMCFTPAQNTTYSQLWINVTGFAGALARILIYSDLNGQPNTKIYESTNLDCSTSGQKIVNTSGTFSTGVTYWLCLHINVSFNAIFLQTFISYPLKYQIQGGYAPVTSYSYTADFPFAPLTIVPSGIGNNTGVTPLIGISRG